jgi:hypothetical protein
VACRLAEKLWAIAQHYPQPLHHFNHLRGGWQCQAKGRQPGARVLRGPRVQIRTCKRQWTALSHTNAYLTKEGTSMAEKQDNQVDTLTAGFAPPNTCSLATAAPSQRRVASGPLKGTTTAQLMQQSTRPCLASTFSVTRTIARVDHGPLPATSTSQAAMMQLGGNRQHDRRRWCGRHVR